MDIIIAAKGECCFIVRMNLIRITENMMLVVHLNWVQTVCELCLCGMQSFVLQYIHHSFHLVIDQESECFGVISLAFKV